MGFLADKCTLYTLDQETIKKCNDFSCGHEDLDDFFNNDAHFYSEQLLGKSYCFRFDEDDNFIVCAFTVSNSSIKVGDLSGSRRKRVQRKIPFKKHRNEYPAVLIGRLGVNLDFQGKKIGYELMDFIKMWFANPQNKTGCRFVIVDAYNTAGVIKYYQDNGFEFVFIKECDEREHYRAKKKDGLETRLMYFDLIRLFDLTT